MGWMLCDITLLASPPASAASSFPACLLPPALSSSCLIFFSVPVLVLVLVLVLVFLRLDPPPHLFAWRPLDECRWVGAFRLAFASAVALSRISCCLPCARAPACLPASGWSHAHLPHLLHYNCPTCTASCTHTRTAPPGTPGGARRQFLHRPGTSLVPLLRRRTRMLFPTILTEIFLCFFAVHTHAPTHSILSWCRLLPHHLLCLYWTFL